MRLLTLLLLTAALDALLLDIAQTTHYSEPGDCGELTWAATARLQASGFQARNASVLTLDTWDLVNNGHWLNEVWHPRFASWVVVDFSTDRLYGQTLWGFVQQRGAYETLTDTPALPGYDDSLGIFADMNAFYDRVGQVALIASGNTLWFGDHANRERIASYAPSYAFDSHFIDHFYR